MFGILKETAKEKAQRLLAEDRARIAREAAEDAPANAAWAAKRKEIDELRRKRLRENQARQVAVYSSPITRRGKRGGRFVMRRSRQTGLMYRHYF